MTLGARLTRLEAANDLSTMAVSIIATDEGDFMRQFEAALLSAPGPGPMAVFGSIAGVPFAETIDLGFHEEALERLQ